MNLEARDLNHEVELISKYARSKVWPGEIRPSAGLSEMVCENEERQRNAASAQS